MIRPSRSPGTPSSAAPCSPWPRCSKRTIWVHPKDVTSSLVLATLKEGGLDVYDLSGALVQHVAPDAAWAGQDLSSARYNNVDLIYGLKVGSIPTGWAPATRNSSLPWL